MTLSAGVRYEFQHYPGARRRGAVSALARGARTTATTSRRASAITWRPFGSERTAVRGGYGIFYDTTSLGLIVNAAQINGRRILSYVVPGTDARAPQYPEPAEPRAMPAFSTPPSITVFPEDFEIDVRAPGELGVERQLTDHLLASVGYSYWGHRDAPYSRDINLGPVVSDAGRRPAGVSPARRTRPNPAFRAINLVESKGRSSYHRHRPHAAAAHDAAACS